MKETHAVKSDEEVYGKGAKRAVRVKGSRGACGS